MKRELLVLVLLGAGCSAGLRGLDPGDTAAEPGAPVEDDLLEQLSVEWQGESFLHGDSVVLAQEFSEGSENREYTLRFTNHSASHLTLLGQPPVSIWPGEGLNFTLLDTPEEELAPGASMDVSFSVPFGPETSHSQIGFTWGLEQEQRFWVNLECPGQEGGDVEPPKPESEERFIAVGYGGVIAVSDAAGEHWDTSWPGESGGPFVRPDQEVYRWNEVVYTGERILLFGQEGSHSGTSTIAWESLDGYEWSTVPLDGVRNQPVRAGVALDSGVEVFISASAAYISPADESTILKTADFEDSGTYRTVTDLATDGTHVIAVKETDHFLRTEDGENWVMSGAGAVDNELYNIHYADGTFLAVGSDHRAVLSTDGGDTWELSDKVRDGWPQFTHKCARPDTWCKVQYDGVQFIVYERGRDDVGTAMRWTSPEGVAWTGEELEVERMYDDGETTRAVESFMEWGVSQETGVVVAIETSNKTVEEGAVRPFYRSTDGLQFTSMIEELSDLPILTAVGVAVVESGSE